MDETDHMERRKPDRRASAGCLLYLVSLSLRRKDLFEYFFTHSRCRFVYPCGNTLLVCCRCIGEAPTRCALFVLYVCAGADVFASGPASFVIPRSYNRLRQRRHDATADAYADCLLTSEKALSSNSDLAVPQISTPVSSSWSDESTSWESFNLPNTRLCPSSSGRSGYLSEEDEQEVPGDEGNEPPWSSCFEPGVLSSMPSTPPPAQIRSASTYKEGVAVPLAGEPGLGSAKHEWIADQEAGYDFAALDNVDGFMKCCVDVADVILNQNASVAKVYVSVDGAEQAQRLAQGWLQRSRKKLRYYLSQKMRRRRRIPELFFHIVDTKGIAKMLLSLHRLEVEEVIPYELKQHSQTAKANETVQDDASSTHSKVP
ncbi:UNVERIFIED_CONTAM: hypothetical protein HHA_298040 [Hammondia hammondi]|eukprot:XP_008886055.1 hypothetical protein HHA_298040 [Hammondia hammondi]